MKYAVPFIVTLLSCVLLYQPTPTIAAESPTYFSNLFGYDAVRYTTLDDLPEWTKVLHRHPREDFNHAAPFEQWSSVLLRARDQSPAQQMRLINRFTNTHDYILDIDNYGVDDYWAIVREFFVNNGDCEDYAITKYFSLRQLGFSEETLRIVVLQDTNLGIAHAVVAVALDGDIFILDNQVDAVLSHRQILHYTPLFSVNEHEWWLHIPRT